VVKTEIQKIINNFYERLISSKKINISDTILIAGSPRSGTTWLMELMGRTPFYWSIFEPLNPNWFPESLQKGFTSRTYLPPEIEWAEGEDYLRKVFTGKIFSSNTEQFVISDLKSMFYSIFANKIIVKEVRINRLLPWIIKRYQLKGTILILRHPCAVICSQLKTGYTAYHPTHSLYENIIPSNENIFQEATAVDGLDQNLLNKIKRLNTPEELLAATWCLDTYVPLHASQPHPWMTVIYEKLFKQGEKEITEIFNFIGQNKIPSSILVRIKHPSRVTNKSEWNTLQSTNQQLNKWKHTLTGHQITRILKVVSDFGLDFYTEDPEPDYERLYKEKIIR
jgi:hypothetical protein